MSADFISRYDIIQYLKSVRTLVLGGWLNDGRAAARADGTSCDVLDERAAQFCITGALCSVADVQPGYLSKSPLAAQLRYKLIDALANLHLGERFGCEPLIEWNNAQSSVDEVVRLIDKAIEMERARILRCALGDWI